MKYFTYSRQYVEGNFFGPEGFLPTNTTHSVFYSANWFCASEIEDYSSIYMFDITDISKEYFDEAFAAQPHSGSI